VLATIPASNTFYLTELELAAMIYELFYVFYAQDILHRMPGLDEMAC
jgi:hypothetical protein